MIRIGPHDVIHAPSSTSVSLLPVASRHYDTFLQRALSRFSSAPRSRPRSAPSPSSDGRLAIEATDDPAALMVRWFGNRYMLRVPARRPFTAHEVRFARAIGAVLESRYRAILNPQLMVERPGLFRGAIEDRYVGAFFDGTPYSPRADGGALERVAEVLEMLRVAALSSYENQPISTGVLLLDGDRIRWRVSGVRARLAALHGCADVDQELLSSGRRRAHRVSRRRATAGCSTSSTSSRWARSARSPASDLRSPCARAYTRTRARRWQRGHVCVGAQPEPRDQGLCRRRAGVHVPQRRLAPARSAGEVRDVGGSRGPGLRWRDGCFRPRSIWPMRARARCSSCCATRSSRSQSWSPASDRLDMELVGQQADPDTPSRRDLLHVLAGRTRDRSRPQPCSPRSPTLDGAVVTDPGGQLLAVGAILRHPPATLPPTEMGIPRARARPRRWRPAASVPC